jgi:hypothetical protein
MFLYLGIGYAGMILLGWLMMMIPASPNRQINLRNPINADATPLLVSFVWLFEKANRFGLITPLPFFFSLQSEATRAEVHGLDILRSIRFWVLFFSFFAQSTGLGFVYACWTEFALTFEESHSNIQNVQLYAMLFEAMGRIWWGYLVDIIGPLHTLIILQFISAAVQAIVYWARLSAGDVFFITVLLFSFCYGGTFTAFPGAVFSQFGSTYFAANYGMLYISQTLAVAVLMFTSQTLVNGYGWMSALLMHASMSLFAAMLCFGLLWKTKQSSRP